MDTFPTSRTNKVFTGIVLSLMLCSVAGSWAQTLTNNGIRVMIPDNAHLVINGDYISTSAEGTITLDGTLIVMGTYSAGGNMSSYQGQLFSPVDHVGTLQLQGYCTHHLTQSGIIQVDGLEITTNDGSLLLQQDQSMTILGPLAIQGWLILQSDVSGTASLITKGSVSGLSVVQRYIGSKGDHTRDWHLLSSPVKNQPVSPVFTVGSESPYNFFLWLETDSMWIDYNNTTAPPTFFSANGNSNNFVVGRGYQVGYDKSYSPGFAGELNTSTVALAGLTNTEGGSHTGWNLVGNPFPCALQWNHTDGDSGWALNNISGTAKVWNEALASYHDVYKNEIIPSMQGFMVQVVPGISGETGSLNLYEGDRTHDTLHWYKTAESNVIRLWAMDATGEQGQESVIRFQEGATVTFDHHYDSHFLSGFAPQFYSLNDGHKLSTNVLPSLQEELSIPFCFIRSNSNDFFIEARGLTTLNPHGTVYLTDLKYQITQNLTDDSVYHFTSEEGDDPQRFLLHFRAVGTEDPPLPAPTLFVWSHDHQLYVRNPERLTGSVEIVNMMGQRVIVETLTGEQEQIFQIRCPAGVYIVRILAGQTVYSRKIVIR